MEDVSVERRSEAKPGAIRAMWNKYGLIVVGNVVFFALLYFVQYRPNSRDSRATELLTLAQREESEQRLEAAESVYSKILADYRDSYAGTVARERLPKVLEQDDGNQEQHNRIAELLARAIQHETDHLDGILFLDRLDREARREAMRIVRESEWFGEPAPVVRFSPHTTRGLGL